MDNLICTECGTTYYSAAAATMVDRGELCDCGGRLRVVSADEAIFVPAGDPCDSNGNGAPSYSERRFARD